MAVAAAAERWEETMGEHERVRAPRQRDPRWGRVEFGQNKRRLSSADSALSKTQLEKVTQGHFSQKRQRAQSASVPQQSQRRRNSCPAILNRIAVELCVSMHAQIIARCSSGNAGQRVVDISTKIDAASSAQDQESRILLRAESWCSMLGGSTDGGGGDCLMRTESSCSMRYKDGGCGGGGGAAAASGVVTSPSTSSAPAPTASEMGGGVSAVSPWIESSVSPVAAVSLLPQHYGYAYLTSMRASPPHAPSIDRNGVFLRHVLL